MKEPRLALPMGVRKAETMTTSSGDFWAPAAGESGEQCSKIGTCAERTCRAPAYWNKVKVTMFMEEGGERRTRCEEKAHEARDRPSSMLEESRQAE